MDLEVVQVLHFTKHMTLGFMVIVGGWDHLITIGHGATSIHLVKKIISVKIFKNQDIISLHPFQLGITAEPFMRVNLEEKKLLCQKTTTVEAVK